METELGPEQALLRDTAVRFVDDRLPLTAVRAIADGEQELDGAYLKDAADLGWFAMFVDEDFGGGSVSGDPVGEAALIAEIRGGALQPEPFASVNAAAAILARHGTEEQRARVLPAVATADQFCSLAVAGDASWGTGELTALSERDTLVLSGRVVIPDVSHTSSLLVVAHQEQRRVAILAPLDAPGLTTAPLESLDVTRSLYAASFDNVRLDPRSVVEIDESALDHGLSLAVCLNIAETVGAMDRLFELTRQYALDRIAFGRPIGSFQALKHILADLSLTVESAKALSVAATRTWREDRPYAAESASIARAFLGEHALPFVQGCQQVHGGIGFAWEHDLHLFLRRIASNGAFYGTADQHRARILAAHSSELVAAGAPR